jgi:outer membrane lipoprotein-sorting protein
MGPMRWIAGGMIAALAAGPALAQTHVGVLPPKRPAALKFHVETTGSTAPAPDTAGGAAPITIEPRPIAVAAQSGKPALSDKAVIDRVNAALNGISTLTADFTQTGGDGRRLGGTLYLQRPGKVRFEYDKPSTLEVVSDGTTVLVRDRKLNTSDPYPIGQTPLKFLLSTRIDLAREAAVQSVQTDPDGVRIVIEDSTTLGGTSKITLSFTPDLTTLTRWRVVDPQGYTTTVSLGNQDRNKPIDSKVFMLNYSRPVD